MASASFFNGFRINICNTLLEIGAFIFSRGIFFSRIIGVNFKVVEEGLIVSTGGKSDLTSG